ncbi:MAG TPA: helix-turn-helix transcriptional regulator [Nitrospira sp.]|nr:helix-turn-helix transcriptional regulator [Nitrospira sp.]
MPNPLHDPSYAIFRVMLADVRKQSGVTQVELAARLGKPQSYVSKYERGERRLDFVEFLAVADAVGADLVGFVAEYRMRISRR